MNSALIQYTCPFSLGELLDQHRLRRLKLNRTDRRASELVFKELDGLDVYNVTAPFSWRSGKFLFGRVEARETEHSQLMLFQQEKRGTWVPSPILRPLDCLQDPCFTFVNRNLIVGGVRFPVPLSNGETGWRMEFFHLNPQGQIHSLFVGPDKMKDIRLKQIQDGRIAVFTRPQGSVGGPGKIGFTLFENLESITPEAIASAPLFPTQHPELEWSGANEIHLLKNGMLGVLGHIARFMGNARQYCAMVFPVNPFTGQAGPLQIIAERSDFLKGPAKREDLMDVIFSGGLVRRKGGRATLYAGLSDVNAGVLDIPDPFLPWEQAAPLLPLSPVSDLRGAQI